MATRGHNKRFSIFKLANILEDYPNVPPKKPILPKLESEKYMGRVVLVELEGGEYEDHFIPKFYLVGQIIAYSALRGLFKIQYYNQSGEKDGSPDYEKAGDLWLMPAVKEVIGIHAKPDSVVRVVEYNIPGMTVTVARPTAAQIRAFEAAKKTKKKPSTTDAVAAPKTTTTTKKNTQTATTAKATGNKQVPKKKSANTKSKNPKSPKKGKGKGKTKSNKKRDATSPAGGAQKRKALDKVTSGSNMDDEEDARFTVKSVLDSFANPRTKLFLDSLSAELEQRPELMFLTPKDVDKDPPDILFKGRRKGFFKCPALERLAVLDILKELRQRGEFFTLWKDELTGVSYDGLSVLAHAFVIKYISRHNPAMSIKFRPDGSIKATSVHVLKLRK